VQFRLSEPLQVTLYYPSEGMLRTGSAAVLRHIGYAAVSGAEALSALFADQRRLAPVLRGSQSKGLYLDAAGTAYARLTSRIPPEG